MPPKKGGKAKAPAKKSNKRVIGTTPDALGEDAIVVDEAGPSMEAVAVLSPSAQPPEDLPIPPAPAPEPPIVSENESVDVGDSPLDEAPATASMTMDERQAKLEQLRLKMRSSLQANRKDLVDEDTKLKTSVRDAARYEKQRKLAEVLREKVEADDRGEDVDRKKNWEYSIEENDEWEKRQARKKRRSNFEFNDYEDAARRRYKKDVDGLKPNLAVYEQQKAATLGSSSTALAASADLYRDANSLIYADNKPTDDAIDRVVAKINLDTDRRRNFSKTRVNEKEGDVTYINEANRVFNKKIDRYYNKYTAEIRANFERGTAL
ncbi:hypothetical protein FRB96_002376 [Tulasnella sp. 330]|nr:hypothetical protein FRB96_002376 [Tulasnella sp. 330]KAG8883108.1 hypothetical protein FRB97_007245 [Tulasnella sp. 331]